MIKVEAWYLAASSAVVRIFTQVAQLSCYVVVTILLWTMPHLLPAT
jgi:hypothetical protein